MVFVLRLNVMATFSNWLHNSNLWTKSTTPIFCICHSPPCRKQKLILNETYSIETCSVNRFYAPRPFQCAPQKRRAKQFNPKYDKLFHSYWQRSTILMRDKLGIVYGRLGTYNASVSFCQSVHLVPKSVVLEALHLATCVILWKAPLQEFLNDFAYNIIGPNNLYLSECEESTEKRKSINPSRDRRQKCESLREVNQIKKLVTQIFIRISAHVSTLIAHNAKVIHEKIDKKLTITASMAFTIHHVLISVLNHIRHSNTIKTAHTYKDDESNFNKLYRKSTPTQ